MRVVIVVVDEAGLWHHVILAECTKATIIGPLTHSLLALSMQTFFLYWSAFE